MSAWQWIVGWPGIALFASLFVFYYGALRFAAFNDHRKHALRVARSKALEEAITREAWMLFYMRKTCDHGGAIPPCGKLHTEYGGGTVFCNLARQVWWNARVDARRKIQFEDKTVQ